MIKTHDKMGKVASWIIVDNATNKPVAEVFEKATAERINTAKYTVYTAYEWLVQYNLQTAIANNRTAQKTALHLKQFAKWFDLALEEVTLQNQLDRLLNA